jgi:hypothetical protein
VIRAREEAFRLVTRQTTDAIGLLQPCDGCACVEHFPVQRETPFRAAASLAVLPGFLRENYMPWCIAAETAEFET